MYNEVPSFTIKIKSANELCAKKTFTDFCLTLKNNNNCFTVFK